MKIDGHHGLTPLSQLALHAQIDKLLQRVKDKQMEKIEKNWFYENEVRATLG